MENKSSRYSKMRLFCIKCIKIDKIDKISTVKECHLKCGSQKRIMVTIGHPEIKWTKIT